VGHLLRVRDYKVEMMRMDFLVASFRQAGTKS